MKTVTSKLYDGVVSKGLKNGLGQIVYPSGSKFKGQFKNDLRHGLGICLFANGAIFKGEWRDDKPQGIGILYSYPNEIIECRFDGFKIFDGLAKLLLGNGEYYEGQIK